MANYDYSVLIKAILDKSGINADLKEIQAIIDKHTLKITPELKTSDLKNQIKALSGKLAADFNKAFNLNLTGKDIFKAFEKQINSIAKQEADLEKQLNQANSGDKAIASTEKRIAVLADLNNYLSKNTAITQESKEKLQEWSKILNSPGVTNGIIENINDEFIQLDANMRRTGKLGKSTIDTLKQYASKFTPWASTSGFIEGIASATRRSVSELKDIDSILTEISKSSDMTKQELQELGRTSFGSASNLGRTAADYLTAVEEMSRSGFHGKQGEDMANQVLLTQSAGNTSREVAIDYVLDTNAAYKFNGEATKLNEVLDGQNNIANRHSVTMTDMAKAMSEAGSVAANYRVSIEDLSAMIGTMGTVTQSGGSEIGNSLKSILTNLQDITSSEIVGTLDTANASMTEIVNGTEQLRDPISILRDLAKTFNELGEADPLRSEILTNIGGADQAAELAALLGNMEMYDTMLADYANGSGSAMEEAMKSANSWEGSLNKLSNTWTSTVGNIANSDAIVTAINGLNGILTIVNKLTGTIGSLGSIVAGISLASGIKNVGRAKCCPSS